MMTAPDPNRTRRALRRALALAAVLVILVALLGLGAWASLEPAPPAELDRPHPEPTSVELRVGGELVRVHALPTGTIRIKRCHHDLCVPESASYGRRFLSILRDDAYAEPMPIWTYLIEHPEGRFVIDTGADAELADLDSWTCDPVGGRIVNNMARVDLRAGETLGARLAALGLGPADLQAAIITHLHFDHTGGIRELGIPTYVGQGDLDAGQLVGSVFCRMLAGAELIPIAQTDPGQPLTRDGSLRVVPTPGHTPGSLSVRLETDAGVVWFIGDTSFDERALDPEGPTASIHMLMPEVRALQAEFAGRRDAGALLLPAHDDDADVRLRAFAEAAERAKEPSRPILDSRLDTESAH